MLKFTLATALACIGFTEAIETRLQATAEPDYGRLMDKVTHIRNKFDFLRGRIDKQVTAADTRDTNISTLTTDKDDIKSKFDNIDFLNTEAMNDIMTQQAAQT